MCEGSYFERLLTRFTVPEELFGPLSLQALEEDQLRRKTEGYLPECDVAFIDEIFKVCRPFRPRSAGFNPVSTWFPPGFHLVSAGKGRVLQANSSILNSLLVILNERRFDNGDLRLAVPLWCAVAASNELPERG